MVNEARALKAAIELHDSECVDIYLEGSRATLTLDAYVHRTESNPGHSPGEGGKQRVSIVVESSATSGPFGCFPALIYRGDLVVGGRKLDLVPLPFDSPQSCELTLTLADDAREVRIIGTGISVRGAGEFHFIEPLDFSH